MSRAARIDLNQQVALREADVALPTPGAGASHLALNIQLHQAVVSRIRGPRGDRRRTCAPCGRCALRDPHVLDDLKEMALREGEGEWGQPGPRCGPKTALACQPVARGPSKAIGNTRTGAPERGRRPARTGAKRASDKTRDDGLATLDYGRRAGSVADSKAPFSVPQDTRTSGHARWIRSFTSSPWFPKGVALSAEFSL